MAKFKTVLIFSIIILSGILCGYIAHLSLSTTQYSMQRLIQKSVLKSSEAVESVNNFDNNDERVNELDFASNEKGKNEMKEDDIGPEMEVTAKTTERLPIKVFINCGGTFPLTLDLFYSTYPQSWEYQVHTFLEDSSYQILYRRYPNHLLHTPVIASFKESTENKEISKFASMLSLEKKVDHLDLSQWIMQTFTKDDYIILKTDSSLDEKAILHRLVSTGAVKWIGKFYTTSTNETIREILDKELNLENQHVLVWDNDFGTYQDFDGLNPEEIPIGRNIDKCFGIDEAQFAFVLRSKCKDENVVLALRDVLAYANNRKIPICIALSLEFFKSEPDLTKRLFELFNVGMILKSIQSDSIQSNSDNENYNDRDKDIREQNYYRNQLVHAAQIVKKNTGDTLQYIFPEEEIPLDVLEDLETTRHVTIVKNLKDITKHVKKLLQTNTVKMDSLGTSPGDILSVNLNEDYSHTLSLYITKKMEPWLVPLYKCQRAAENHPSSSDVTTSATMADQVTTVSSASSIDQVATTLSSGIYTSNTLTNQSNLIPTTHTNAAIPTSDI